VNDACHDPASCRLCSQNTGIGVITNYTEANDHVKLMELREALRDTLAQWEFQILNPGTSKNPELQHIKRMRKRFAL